MIHLIPETVYTAIVGLALIVSAAAILVRQIILRADVALKYPKAPFGLQTVMFASGVLMMIAGWSAVFAAAAGRPWRLEAPMFMLTFCFLAMSLSTTAEVLRQGYGARVWSRVYQLWDLARCKPERRAAKAAAVATLLSEGATVAPPNHDGVPLDRTV